MSSTVDPRQALLNAIAALEAHRATLGDAAVEIALGPLRERLAALGAAAPATADERQLRQVSVLFLDIVGSTRLSQHLDPEDIQDVVDSALAAFTGIVQRHDGEVLVYAGDSLLAAFGARGTREDDAERAVRCGLGLLQEASLRGQALRAERGLEGFDARVGIHTGPVLRGGGVDEGNTLRGLAVNIAARMEQTAPVGGLRISHDTYSHVRGLFEVRTQEPLAVKGVDTPVRSHIVVRARPRSFRIAWRGIEGVATRMVGRDAELCALQDAFAGVVAAGTLAALTVVADAGIGKSRLLAEFEAWLDEAGATGGKLPVLFRGRATPQTQGQPYGLLRDVLAWRLQIADDDTLAAARAKVEQGIAPIFARGDGEELAQAHAHVLGHLVGIDFRDSPHLRSLVDDPRQLRQRAFHVAAQVFVRVAAQAGGRPLVLALEDLHWADDASLDFLEQLFEVNREVPMLVLAMARPTLFERRAGWGGNRHRRIELHALGSDEARHLADELLQRLPETPAALRELVTRHAEGNPFYMEELVKMLIDQGAIDTGAGDGRDGGAWRMVPEKLLVTRVPATLVGVLQARLDGLPVDERETLQEASVIGPVFWEQALQALDARSEYTLPRLVRRELALQHADVALDGLREFAFRHHLLHQVTYDTVLKRRRRELHGQVARWLAGLAGVRANDFLGATAWHYEQAGDLLDAAEFHARAAEHARGRFAHDAVLEHVSRALGLLSAASLATRPLATLRWRLHDVREQTLELRALREPQRADLQAMQELADVLDDDARRAEVSCRRATVALRTGDLAACELHARQTMALAGRAGQHVLRLRAQQQLCAALAYRNDIASAEALALQGLEEARERGLRGNEALFLNMLGYLASQRDDRMRLLDLCRQTLEVNRATGDRRMEAISLANLGVTLMDSGSLDEAGQHLDDGLRLLRANGDRTIESNALSSLSTLALYRDDAPGAAAHARLAARIAEAAEAREQHGTALLRLGQAESALGDHVAALGSLQAARTMFEAIGHPRVHDTDAALVQAALARGDLAAACMHAEQLRAHLRGGGTLDGVETRPVYWALHEALARTGDSQAEEWLLRAHDELQAEAARIADAQLRHAFLTNLPHHRDIAAAWAARQARG